MFNISLNKEPIKVESNVKYIVIDALYLNDIRDNLLESRNEHIININDIRKVFPYNDTPFAEYIPNNNEINLNQVKAVNCYSPHNTPSEINIFSVDSGIIIFINKKKLIDFASRFSYYELINTNVDIVDINYWKNITSGYSYTDIALILSPSIDSEVEFQGVEFIESLINSCNEKTININIDTHDN